MKRTTLWKCTMPRYISLSMPLNSCLLFKKCIIRQYFWKNICFNHWSHLSFNYEIKWQQTPFLSLFYYHCMVLHTFSLSLACFSASLASLWILLSSLVCCCSLKPFCFCKARVIHNGPASFSCARELSKECLLCNDGFSVGERSYLNNDSGNMLQCPS